MIQITFGIFFGVVGSIFAILVSYTIADWYTTYNPDSLWNRIKYNIRYRYYKYKLEH